MGSVQEVDETWRERRLRVIAHRNKHTTELHGVMSNCYPLALPTTCRLKAFIIVYSKIHRKDTYFLLE
uniref:Uncharacterized protein n=1 Tax=Triticum urartu TaxID=4572 RepID=A0A8R7QCF5_TRIUA